jgi:hypothetical protein
MKICAICGSIFIRLVRRVEEHLYDDLSTLGVRLGLPRAIQIRAIRSPRGLREATDWSGFAHVLAAELGVPLERATTYMMTLKLYEQLAAGQGIYVLPGVNGLDALPPSLLQLASGLSAAYRRPTQGRS